jgi:hypothetical protein
MITGKQKWAIVWNVVHPVHSSVEELAKSGPEQVTHGLVDGVNHGELIEKF